MGNPERLQSDIVVFEANNLLYILVQTGARVKRCYDEIGYIRFVEFLRFSISILAGMGVASYPKASVFEQW